MTARSPCIDLRYTTAPPTTLVKMQTQRYTDTGLVPKYFKPIYEIILIYDDEIVTEISLNIPRK